MSLCFYTGHAVNAHLQQLLQERDEVRPFVNVVKRTQALLHLLCVLLVLRIRRIARGCRSYCKASQSAGALALGIYSLPSPPRSAYHGAFFCSPLPTRGELRADMRRRSATGRACERSEGGVRQESLEPRRFTLPKQAQARRHCAKRRRALWR